MIQNFGLINGIRPIHNVGAKKMRASERLSSGKKINHAADDAAGFAISQAMEAQIRGLKQADSNITDAISLIQTAEGALSSIQSMLNRMVELTVQSLNDVYVTQDRQKMQREIDQIIEEIDSIANTATFNEKLLLDGSLGDNSRDTFSKTLYNAKGALYKPAFSKGASWTGNIDLSKIRDGVTLKINNTVFEFDSDGFTNTNGTVINFNPRQKEKLEDDIKKAIENSTLDGKLDNVTCSLKGTDLNIDIKALDASAVNGEQFRVSMNYSIPDITISASNVSDGFYYDDFIQEGRSIEIEGLDFSKFVDGTTIYLNGIIYEIDLDGVVAQGHTPVVISSNFNEDKKAQALANAMMNDFSSVATIGFYSNSNGRIFRMTYYDYDDDDANQPFNIKFNYDIDKNLPVSTTDSQKGIATPEVQFRQANRQELIDFSTIFDGSVLNIDGLKFEFDKDGKTDSSSIAVDISSANDANDIVQAFIKTFNASPETAKYEMNILNADGGRSIIDIKSGVAFTTDGQEISVSFESSGVGLDFQVGSNAGNMLHLNIDSADSSYLGIDDIDVLSEDKAKLIIDKVYRAIDLVTDNRARLGAVQNRLEFIQSSSRITSDNLSAAKSRITDADMAKEMMSLIRANVLEQAAQGILTKTQNFTKEIVRQLLQSS